MSYPLVIQLMIAMTPDFDQAGIARSRGGGDLGDPAFMDIAECRTRWSQVCRLLP
jgi:hypothetical protein